MSPRARGKSYVSKDRFQGSFKLLWRTLDRLNSEIKVTEHLQITDFVQIWSESSPWQPTQESWIFLLSDQYFGNYIDLEIGQICQNLGYIEGLNGNISASVGHIFIIFANMIKFLCKRSGNLAPFIQKYCCHTILG